MKNEPLVSVVVNFYNQAHLVPRALRSVVGQTYENLDIIVVDDGSKDDVERAAQQFDDSRVRFFKQENSGVATARNLGVREAKGQYIAFLDGDDVFLPTKIEEQMDQMLKLDVKVIASGCYFVTKRGVIIGRRICGKFRTTPGDPAIDYPKINPSLLIYDRAVFDELGGFPQSFRIGEDGMFNRLVYNRFSVVSLPRPLVLKERDDSGKSRRIFSSYDDVLSSHTQKMARMKDMLTDADFVYVQNRNRIASLSAFLAVGNMTAAKRWYHEVLHSSLLGKGVCLERFSIRSGANVYILAMHVRNIFNCFRYLFVTVLHRRRWR